jgi:integrase
MKKENWTPDRLNITPRGGGWILRGTLPGGNGNRIQKTFGTKHEAQLEKDKIVKDLGNTVRRETALTLEQEELFLDAEKVLNRCDHLSDDYTVLNAADEIRATVDLLKAADDLPDDFALVDAVKYCINNYSHEVARGVTIKEATESWKNVLQEAGRDEKYVLDMTRYGTWLGKVFGDNHQVAQITTEDIRNFLSVGPSAIGPWKGKQLTASTRKNHKRLVSMFFNFCEQMDYINKHPVNKTIKTPEVNDRKIEILTNEEVVDIFEACQKVRPEISIPYFALAIFAGLRPQEIVHPRGKQCITWENFIFRDEGKQSIVEVEGEVGKTTERRIVELPENCLKWIRPYIKESGPVVPLEYGDWRCLFDSIRCYAGFKMNIQEAKRFDPNIKEVNAKNTKSWPNDGCRHTALTFYYEKVNKNKWVAAEWAGNDPAVYRKHYNAKVKGTLDQTPEEQVEEFYSIEPGPCLAA